MLRRKVVDELFSSSTLRLTDFVYVHLLETQSRELFFCLDRLLKASSPCIVGAAS